MSDVKESIFKRLNDYLDQVDPKQLFKEYCELKDNSIDGVLVEDFCRSITEDKVS